MKLSALWLAPGLLPAVLCAQIPPAVIPAGVGVNIHFITGHARDLDLITNAGCISAGGGILRHTHYEACSLF